MKAAAKATYGRKGDDVVAKNWAAIDEGAKQIKEVAVPESWRNAADEGLTTTHAESGRADAVKFVNTIQAKVTSQEGNNLPVSAFADYVDGTTPSGTSAYEKRGIAVNVPVWNPENCIQCNRCSFVCPHAVIRPVALTAEEAAAAPEGIQTMPMTGMPDFTFTMAISQLDCTGCGSCANVCPGKKGVKALAMESLAAHEAEQKYFDYAAALPEKTDVVAKFKENTVKGSQFKKPLLEFSGACAGCGETPYAKLITQLFGDRMYIANVAVSVFDCFYKFLGCSSVGSAAVKGIQILFACCFYFFRSFLRVHNSFNFGFQAAADCFLSKKHTITELCVVLKQGVGPCRALSFLVYGVRSGR